MPERSSIRIASIPPPIDGIDYISPPDQMPITSARDLLNYYVYDWGIRQVNKPSFWTSFFESIGSIFPIDGGGSISPCLICPSASKMWRVTPSAGTTTNITGGAVITNSFWNMNQFQKRVFMYNGVDVPLVYDIAAGTLGAAGWTGPASVNALYHGWNYKQTEYVVEKSSTNVWFGGTGLITGPMTAFDIAPYLENYSPALCGTSWSYNQGLSNDELWTVLSESGEVLVYYGTDPASTDWQLIGRAQIPTPVGSKCLRKLGQDVLVTTIRGVISLKDVFAGRNEDASYYSVSRKINPLNFGNLEVAYSKYNPFLYYQNNVSTDYSLYVLNYERGAWSRINYGFTSSSRPVAMAWLGGTGVGSNGMWYVLNDTDFTLYYIPDEPSDSTGVTHTWKTPFNSFESQYRKSIRYIKANIRNVGGNASNITNSINVELMGGMQSASQSLATVATTDSRYYNIHVDLPDAGDTEKSPSLVFSKTGAGEINEISGLDVFYEEGGL